MNDFTSDLSDDLDDLGDDLGDGLTDEEASLGFIDRATVRTDVDLEHMVDLDRTGQALTRMTQELATDPGRKIGITKNGQVIAVLIDTTDLKNFEGLELEAESEWMDRREREEPDDGTRYTIDGDLITEDDDG
ncbi:hypothetical protein GCM10027059_08840 [Myceligenerans halotolerans]